MEKDCAHQIDYPRLRTEVRGFWTDSDLYLLFISPYYELNLWLPPDNSKDRLKLWDRDVVEFFLGDDWTNINVYREFEIAPTGDWVDLAIDRNRDSYDANWNSGWQREGRIDDKNHTWYAAARVPLHSVSEKRWPQARSGALTFTASMGSARIRNDASCAGSPRVSSTAIPTTFPNILAPWFLLGDRNSVGRNTCLLRSNQTAAGS